MQQTLHDHLLALEDKVQAFHNTLTFGKLSPAERERLTAQIELATEAIAYYRQAYEIEFLLNSDEENSPHAHQVVTSGLRPGSDDN